jgi:putative ABC transport system permease protein
MARRSLRSWLWRVSIPQEVDGELAFHIEMRTRELIERGIDSKAAREMALARVGDLGRLRRTCIDLGRKREREMRITQWLEELRDDVTGAFRQMRAAPGFTVVAALTLALGIGANGAIFALADAALLRPLPFATPQERLAMIWERLPNGVLAMASPLDHRDWAEQNRTFDAMAGFVASGATMPGPDGTPELLTIQRVSVRFFEMLGITPIAGRTFVPADASMPHVIVLGEGFWRQRLGADPSIVGRSITVDGEARTVIGIVPAWFRGLAPTTVANFGTEPPAFWGVFNTPRDERPGLRTSHYVNVVARLRAGVSFDAAQRDITAIGHRNAVLFPESNKGHEPTLQPLREALVGSETRLTSLLLVGVVGFVLLMCCANVANLLLARTAARARELAVRSALGATRRRVVAQLLTESCVLASVGGLVGAGVAWAILQAAPSVVPPGLLPTAVTLSFDGRVVLFCAVASLAVGLLFGVVPAWQSTGVSLGQTIASDVRTASRGGGRVRGVLVIAEVAAAVLVLTGAGLLLRTLLTLQRVDPGYRAQDVLTMTMNVPMPGVTPTRYATPDSVYRFYDAIEREIRQVPGVRMVALGSSLPLDGGWFGQSFEVVGDPPKLQSQRDTASYHMVSPTYFDTLEIPIVQGRAFTIADSRDGAPVCIVSEAFARQYLGGRDPIGMKVTVQPITPITLGAQPPAVRQIVGVARQVKGLPNETQPVPQLYVPIAQNSWYITSISVRPSAGPPEALLPAVRAAIARVDEQRPVTRVRTIETIASSATARPRFRAVLVGTFAALALVLAMVGVFGVLAYSVQQRVREFGVRIAVGASFADVLRLVFGSAARLTAIGLAIGLLAAGVLSRWLTTLVYPVAPLDPVTFSVVPLVLVATAAIAAAAPAWRAAHVDPVVTFRSE